VAKIIIIRAICRSLGINHKKINKKHLLSYTRSDTSRQER